ncbi:MAG: hypothetical protein N2327_01375 [Caldimicrobium sp.]|nr:hypothetical protein [Caldimicrobium sp.]MDW8094897.1 hypothetical protein [Caldimicrobium sp.]
MKGRKYLKKAVDVALGAGTVLIGAFYISKIREKGQIRERLERMENILEKLMEERHATKGVGEEEGTKRKKGG